MPKRAALIPFLLVLAAGCGKSPSEKLAQLSEEFVYETLAFSPSSATATGLHEYQGQKLDEMLDDLRPAALDKQVKFYEKCRDRLGEIKADQLTPEEKADYTILQNQIGLTLLDMKELRPELHNPQFYVETLGNALFNQMVLEYAPKPQRFRDLIARLQKVPLFLDAASTNLVSAPSIWTRIAVEENQGNINLVDKEIRAAVPPELAESYSKAARPALEAMGKFEKFLLTSLEPRSNYPWKLGPNYPRKFRMTMMAGVEADDTLQAAERDLHSVRARMLELARSLRPASKKEPADGSEADRANAVIAEALAEIANHHATPATFMDEARKDLDEAAAFVQQKHMLTLPGQKNLQVIPTPEFMRGVFAVAGFSPPPPLEPQLGAFYWVTPIPADWPADRIESKLREYNRYALKLITIHEAMPGHYVQFEYANAVQPKTRRVLRSVFGNTPYVEGWAQYATQAMLEEGYLDHSRELELTFLKQQLRVLGNTIIDVRLQMLNMTDQEALDLMTKQLFQEKEEATAKLQRAKLTSAQLPSYYVGWRAWVKARDEYKKSKGAGFNLAAFHESALKEGAVPGSMLGAVVK